MQAILLWPVQPTELLGSDIAVEAGHHQHGIGQVGIQKGPHCFQRSLHRVVAAKKEQHAAVEWQPESLPCSRLLLVCGQRRQGVDWPGNDRRWGHESESLLSLAFL